MRRKAPADGKGNPWHPDGAAAYPPPLPRRRRPSRRPRRPRRPRRAAALRFGLVALGLWGSQLALIALRLRRFDWDAYWLLRGFYRPGVILFRALAGPFVPRGTFDPLHPAGARLALAAAALIYALAVAAVAGLAARGFAK